MRRLLTPLAVALVAAVALPAGAASAASVRVDDPTGDVQTVTTDAAGNDTAVAAPGAQPDVTSLTVTHKRRAVVLQLTTTGLASPTGDQGVGAFFRLQGSNKQSRILGVIAVAERPGGRYNELVRASNGKRVCGRAVKSRIDYTTGTVTATVPRRCLGNPKQVRVGSVALTTTASDTAPSNIDDALQAGGAPATLGQGFTPFVKRG